MAEITAVFWDVGGVLLSNAWDHAQRRRTVAEFGLDPREFERRHQRAVPLLDCGRITLDEYLRRTVFFRRRAFSLESFKRFMRAQSRPIPANLALARKLARSGRWLTAALNNESPELNAYRIERFRLREICDVFLSSCYLGVSKPGRAIYERALALTQRKPRECVFIDDRPENLVEPRRMGFRAIQHDGPENLKRELAEVLRVRPGALR